MLRSFGTTLLCVLVSMSAHASVLWRGDFQTGDLSQWPGREITAPDRMTIVTDPVPPGLKYALKALVKQGDNPINDSGNRNELFFEGDKPAEGDERYYHWFTFWPTTYASEPTWQLFTQWHQYQSGGEPPFEFFVNGETIHLRSSGNEIWTTPLVRNRWREFMVHVKWSSDPSVGFVELYLDGTLTLPKTMAATLYSGDSVYMKQGLYRDAAISPDQWVFHSGMTIATTLDDVMPPAPKTTALAAPPSADTSSSASSAPPTTSTGATGKTSLVEGSGGTIHARAGCDASGEAALPAALAALTLVLWRRRPGRLQA